MPHRVSLDRLTGSFDPDPVPVGFIEEHGQVNLVATEAVKGIRDEADKAKAQTTQDLWVKGVNALGGFGRWEFTEFRDWTVMEEDFSALVVRLLEAKNG